MSPGMDQLARDKDLLGRSSITERVTDLLRTRIGEGRFKPGEKLSEDEICTALGVSRNTVREAFRLLTHERLLAHELNRGVFVRRPSSADIADIYRMRMLVECAVLRCLGDPPFALEGLAAAADDGDKAVAAQDWAALGAANFHFHRELIALAGIRRIDETMRSVLAELRLAFHCVDDPRALHIPYLGLNRTLLETLRTGDADLAERQLRDYLDDSRTTMERTASSGE
ncbi:putative HTH-type transcriptional regulator YdfH [Streptomyces sp. YIM 130001]|uniref:GntR family transcriptional regulator n=1 Tax=Streptomyces sp. YIM 130001 TaxID=2259644 RepID=UPI000E64AC82|nr:GntR family transcriptional regulator [Streptomyces sp. YIM 130001]RII14003.1 putative HTH-type transcriptional regulator YdfH [Streptomyces sp. YIM 130001]